LENEDLQSLIDEALKEKHQSGDNNRGTSLFLDTAERYGSNWKTALGLGWGETEELIRQLVQRSPSHSSFSADSKMEREDGATSSKLTVATKFTPTPWRTTVQSVVDACNASRQRLGVDQIDLYMVNMPDIVQPLNKLRPGSVTTTKDEVYWQGLAECYHRGLVKNIGVCNYGPTLLARCQDVLSRHKNAVVPLACNQISYSLLGRQQGAQETIQYCRKEGIKVMAAYPLAMGLLTSKYYTSSSSSNGPENETSNTSLRTSAKSALETRDLRGYAERIQPLLSVMADIAQSRQKSMAQVALNYITCQGVIPIPGARTVEQFQDNAGSMGWSLTATELARLEQAADALQLNFDGAGFKRTSEKFVGYGMEKFALD
jgi:pyridoxine 4-dehydrogenase